MFTNKIHINQRVRQLCMLMSLVVYMCLVHTSASAQTGAMPYTSIYGEMRFSDLIVKEGEVISNVIAIKNISNNPREFFLEIGCPGDWKVLGTPGKVYHVEGNDSLFIPIRMLPNLQTMTGNTKYNVSVFIMSVDGTALGLSTFNASKVKKVDWKMSVLPRSRIYFLNDEYQTSLGIRIANNGEEAQDVNMSWQVLGQGLSVTAGEAKNRSFLDFTVRRFSDTTVTFLADLSQPSRNYKRMDLENYTPVSMNDARKFTIYFRAVEPKYAKGRSSNMVSAEVVKLNSSVDFIKLSNTYKVNNYGSSVIPITWYSNVYNILGIQPIALNMFNLNMPMRDGGQLTGQLQHYFTFYSPSEQTYRNIRGGLSYYGNKWNFSIGQGAGLRGIQVGGIGSGNTGTGLSVGYRITNNWQVSSFYSLSPGLFATEKTMQNGGAGVSYNSPKRDLNVTAGYVANDFLLQPSFVHTVFGGVRYRFLNTQQITFRYGKSIRRDSIGLPDESRSTYDNWMAMYSGNFFGNKFNQSMSFGMYSNYILSGDQISINRTYGSFRSTWNFSYGRAISLGTGYQNSESVTATTTTTFTSIPVNLQLNLIKSNGYTMMPSFFYTYSKDNNGTLHFRGITYNTSYYSVENNTKASFSFTGGYNHYTDSLDFRELFSATTAVTAGYRTISTGIRYAYGPLGLYAVRNFHYAGMRYPQYIFSNVNYQYTFKNTRFIGDLSLNHSWNNQTYTNNIGLSPQLYYFTRNGWRFNMRLYYNLNARNNDRAEEFYQYQGYDDVFGSGERITYTNNFNISVGIKKEFGIPVPKRFRHDEFVDATFVAFLDFNGNKILDKDEVPLENVVIKVNGHEVITDKEGKAYFLNIPKGRYGHQVLPLVEMDGWFTYSRDSIDILGELYAVPFTRGVKVSGSVVLDREKYTKDVLATIDLSGIRIFTTDTLGNTMATVTDYDGNFSFYVPYGSYVLSMDDAIIGDQFIIARNYIPMDLYDGMDGFFQSFFIIEKRRTVKKKKFNEKGELVMVEEISADDAENPTALSGADSIAAQKQSTTQILKTNRQGTDAQDDDGYAALDARINRLDQLINILLESKDLGEVNNTVLAESLRQLKNEEAMRQQANNNQPFLDAFDVSRPYHLVIGGFLKLEDAERYANDLATKGFTQARVIGLFNGHYLVRINDYSTREDAINAQAKYGYTIDGLWILTWPQ